MPENKVVSLDERAKDEEKPFLEQLLQEGVRKLLQAASAAMAVKTDRP